MPKDANIKVAGPTINIICKRIPAIIPWAFTFIDGKNGRSNQLGYQVRGRKWPCICWGCQQADCYGAVSLKQSLPELKLCLRKQRKDDIFICLYFEYSVTYHRYYKSNRKKQELIKLNNRLPLSVFCNKTCFKDIGC